MLEGVSSNSSQAPRLRRTVATEASACVTRAVPPLVRGEGHAPGRAACDGAHGAGGTGDQGEAPRRIRRVASRLTACHPAKHLVHEVWCEGRSGEAPVFQNVAHAERVVGLVPAIRPNLHDAPRASDRLRPAPRRHSLARRRRARGMARRLRPCFFGRSSGLEAAQRARRRRGQCRKHPGRRRDRYFAVRGGVFGPVRACPHACFGLRARAPSLCFWLGKDAVVTAGGHARRSGA